MAQRPPSAIPTVSGDLDALLVETDRQSQEVRALADRPAGFRWRPPGDRWSQAGHIAHLVLTNEPYLEAMAECLEEARSRGWVGDGPYRHPAIARWFANSMEPPPRIRVKTFRSLVPDDEPSAPADGFEGAQRRLAGLLRDARGVDLGRARFRSPFARLLKLSLGTGFHLILAHNRRHLWTARRNHEEAGFPA